MADFAPGIQSPLRERAIDHRPSSVVFCSARGSIQANISIAAGVFSARDHGHPPYANLI